LVWSKAISVDGWLGQGWTPIIALVRGYAVAVLATPAGVSGAVLLLPFQVRVLRMPSLASARFKVGPYHRFEHTMVDEGVPVCCGGVA
jgi:hypothetical protein